MQPDIGKIHGLQQCTSRRGTFTCLALDHRQGLRRAMNPLKPEAISDAELTRFKLEVCQHLAGDATAVLLDPEYSAAQAIHQGIIPKGTGLVVALEATGYTGDPNARESQLLPGWSVAKAKRMGADMVKLLVYYHPDAPTATEIEAFVAQVGTECHRHDLALMLEPLSYSLDPSMKKVPSVERRYVVSETVRRLVTPGIDLVKIEFPLDTDSDPDENTWFAACLEVSTAATTPWILLSAAVDYPTFLRQVLVACQAGASGVAVGRAVWKEAINLDPQERANFLSTTARERLARLTAVCTALAKPYYDFYPHIEQNLTGDWHVRYGA